MSVRARSVREPFLVSFVCTGNICRSPMAALMFGARLRAAGLADRVQVTSAGIGPWHVGEPADPRAVTLLAEHGDPTEHVARQVGDLDLAADLLVALDSGHRQALRRLLPSGPDPDRVRLLRSFDPAATGLDVPDPYYGGRADFDAVYAAIDAALPGLLAEVAERVRGRG